ncbi:MAG: hypothetical protein DBX55_00835 [Verrucomicrobia bacterium]|nr:MAG: hypothetical protein DBX55_00835 [Verrucomicrobiota bacterium]
MANPASAKFFSACLKKPRRFSNLERAKRLCRNEREAAGCTCALPPPAAGTRFPPKFEERCNFYCTFSTRRKPAVFFRKIRKLKRLDIKLGYTNFIPNL